MKGYVDIHINALKEIFQIDIQSNNIKITHISTSEELAKKTYFKGFARIELIMNDEMMNLLGLNTNFFILFSLNNYLDEQINNTIIGDKVIDFKIYKPSFFYIYTDIIEPIPYGNQMIQILDVLTLLNNKSISERKQMK